MANPLGISHQVRAVAPPSAQRCRLARSAAPRRQFAAAAPKLGQKRCYGSSLMKNGLHDLHLSSMIWQFFWPYDVDSPNIRNWPTLIYSVILAMNRIILEMECSEIQSDRCPKVYGGCWSNQWMGRFQFWTNPSDVLKRKNKRRFFQRSLHFREHDSKWWETWSKITIWDSLSGRTS